MTERPILFSAPMVKAILEGRKTKTRRLVRIQPPNGYIPQIIPLLRSNDKKIFYWDNGDSFSPPFACPYGTVGNRLWVRETWKLVPETAYHLSEGVLQTINPSDPHEAAIYKCGWERSPGGVPWKPSIFMPRWASRITLEITDIKVERLQDITEEDAIAEGIHLCAGIDEEGYTHGYHWGPVSDAELLFNSAADAYRKLWDSINGQKPGKTWQDNPWVWVIEFRRINND